MTYVSILKEKIAVGEINISEAVSWLMENSKAVNSTDYFQHHVGMRHHTAYDLLKSCKAEKQNRMP